MNSLAAPFTLAIDFLISEIIETDAVERDIVYVEPITALRYI
jgi:hypothetical protein